MSHGARCSCEYCAQNEIRIRRLRVAPAPEHALGAWVAALFLLLAILGVLASWWITPH